MTDALIVLCTFPSTALARQIGTQVVEMQLAACVNILPQCESIYQWQGKLQQDQEILCLFKTTKTGFQPLKEHLLEHHGYDVPEVLAMEIQGGSEEYLQWLYSSVKKQMPPPESEGGK